MDTIDVMLFKLFSYLDGMSFENAWILVVAIIGIPFIAALVATNKED